MAGQLHDTVPATRGRAPPRCGRDAAGPPRHRRPDPVRRALRHPCDLLAAALAAQPRKLGSCVVPLWSVLYPPAGRGSPARQGREARPDPQGPGTSGPASPSQRTAPRPCPAPHQPGHRPNNRPPLPPAHI